MLEGGLSRALFSASLASGLADFYRRNEKAMSGFSFPRPVNIAQLTSVRRFDAAVTAPAGGYGSVDEYYRDASSHLRLESVRVPLLCVSAANDPIVCGTGMPLHSSRNEQVAFVLTEGGGHLGWIENSWNGLSECWVDRVVDQFFSQLKCK